MNALSLILIACFISSGWYVKQHSDEAVDHIVIYKSQHRLILKRHHQTIASYPVSLGYHAGKKQFEGDGKTPEGRYYIVSKNPRSIYYLSLYLSYPNDADRAFAKTHHRSAGTHITIHGTGKDPSLKKRMSKLENWTRGCIGLSNRDISAVYARVRPGTPVDIYP